MASEPQGDYSEYKWRGTLLRTYAILIAYRFREQLGPPLRLYNRYEGKLTVEQILEKARASLTTSGVFFAFSIAVLAALISADKFGEKLFKGLGGLSSWKGCLGFSLSVVFPYWVIWQERFISAVSSIEKKVGGIPTIRRCRYWWLVPPVLVSILTLAAPSVFHQFEDEVLQFVFALSGFFLIVLSTFFLLVSLEFYDYAAGWRPGKELHFHLASIASHSMSFGVSLALMGVSLLVCLLDFRVGRIITFFSLVVVVAMPEIERHLGYWRPRFSAG